MPHESAEGSKRRVASVEFPRAGVEMRLVRGAVQVCLEVCADAECVGAPRALPHPAGPRAVEHGDDLELGCVEFVVGALGEERVVEEDAVGVGHDENVVDALAVDARGADSRLPVRDQVAFVGEGPGAGIFWAVVIASVVDGGVEMRVEVGFRDEGAFAVLAVPVVNRIMFSEAFFVLKFLPQHGQNGHQRNGKANTHLSAVTTVIVVIRIIIVVDQNVYVVEQEAAFIAVMVEDAFRVMHRQGCRVRAADATSFAIMMISRVVNVMFFEGRWRTEEQLAFLAVLTAMPLGLMILEFDSVGEEVAAFCAVVVVSTALPMGVQIFWVRENEVAVLAASFRMLVHMVLLERFGIRN